MLCSLYVVCYVLVMDVYNDKVVGNSDDTTADTVTYTDSKAISIPAIQNITKDDNFVDVSNIVCSRICVYVVYACVCVCMGGGEREGKAQCIFSCQCVHHCVVFYNNRDHLNKHFQMRKKTWTAHYWLTVKALHLAVTAVWTWKTSSKLSEQPTLYPSA